MKRIVILIATCLIVCLALMPTNVAQAQPMLAISLPGLKDIELTLEQRQQLSQLESEIMPKLESILTPEQREQLSVAVSEGGLSLRKAFKSLTLTPEQKSEFGSFFKSLPQKDVFAAMTPEQKRKLFNKKKEFFMPTPEEISEKISEKMKFAKEESGGLIMSPGELGEKISEKLKMVKAQMAK
jgi:hypothetical protein